MINQIKLFLEQQNELILRQKKYLIRLFKSNNGLYFTFVFHLPDNSKFLSIEFGMEHLQRGHIQMKDVTSKRMLFNSFKVLIDKLNKLEILKETHDKIIKKVSKFLKENSINKSDIKNSKQVGL